VGEEGAIGAHMARLLERMGRAEEIPEPAHILELNPEHPVVRALQQIHAHNADDPKVEDYGRILYGQALVAAGEPLHDPADFARRLNALLLRDTIAG
jgi:molecular chaperone HtpG